jgi:hypothetical protein
MDCSTSLTHLPILPRLPRGLVLLLIVSLILQLVLLVPRLPPTVLPALTLIPGHTPLRVVRFRRCRPRVSFSRWGHLFKKVLPRLCARSALLATLLQTSGWHTLTPWTELVLLIPSLQTVITVMSYTQHTPTAISPWNARLQRLYQLILLLLTVSTLIHFLGGIPHASPGNFLSVALGVSATSTDDEAEVYIDPLTENQFHIVLRGAFHVFWESQDSFEEMLLMLFLRRLQRCGKTSPFLSQAQVARAFGVSPMTVSHWESQVKQYSWHVLSDRYRHAVQSVLPEPDLSRAILQVWVPAFWLSAWDVRERLIQRGVILSRETLDVDSIHALAKHMGFNQVRDLLLERFDCQDHQLIAKENWWLRELVALNERLIAKLEKGERLLPQEIVEIEPLRLKAQEKQGDFDLAPRPLVATLKSVLFDPLPAISAMPSAETPQCAAPIATATRSRRRAKHRCAKRSLIRMVSPRSSKSCAITATIQNANIKVSHIFPRVSCRTLVIWFTCAYWRSKFTKPC